jgi:hypothetical protein
MIKEGQGGTEWKDKGGSGISRGATIKKRLGGAGWNDKGGAGRSRVE